MESIGNYAYVALFLVAGVGFVLFAFALSALFRPHRPYGTKLISYECGEVPRTEAWVQYNARYYIFAMLFVLFDVEAAFLIPWAVGFRTLYSGGTAEGVAFDPMGALVFWEMLIFLAILALALIYAWRKGALEWV
jgi:NADH-quinone oxidoreductase subunit A